ncbi:MAG TPA: tRNA uridine-5-carboxymethylaminomethyl(34) synthesis enzyme MnmG, partial [Armatimonadota bacterium]
AGINGALLVQGRDALVLDRSDAYIGVMIDDLITKGVNDPYRLLTSRAEHRLLLRQDNADIRLTRIGREIGLVRDGRWQAFSRKAELIDAEIARLQNTYVKGIDHEKLPQVDLANVNRRISLEDLLRRPEIKYADIARLNGRPEDLPSDVEEQVELQIKYDGYISRQRIQVERHKRLEAMRVPDDLDYAGISSLSREGREKFARILPSSIGQASRIPGITPADISILMVVIERLRRENAPESV